LLFPAHRAHDYRHLVRRWRMIAEKAGLQMRPFALESGYRVYFVRRPRMTRRGGIYISAGIHGDEPAGTEALICWAERNVKKLAHLPCLIFPCLNPWGLVNNSRFDEQHRDLNRQFQAEDVGMIRTLKELIARYQFDLALTLHEDYDGQGLYIYEVERAKPFWGESLLDLARPLIPIEGRTTIDGRRSMGGLVRRRINLKRFPMLPEAVYLHLHHAVRTFTFETPSEFGLDQRVAVLLLLIEECIQRTLGGEGRSE
jgi:murein peptide amidase A